MIDFSCFMFQIYGYTYLWIWNSLDRKL